MSDKVKCPLDPVHVVERHKLVWHLGRCIRSYKAGQHTPLHCPLDYSHIVEAGQMEDHVRNCSQLALAAPLFNVAPDTSVVTGNLRLPDPPSCIDQLVTGEWDEPAPPRAAAAAGGSAYDDDYSGDYGGDSVSEAATSTTTATAAAAGWGRGRGRGLGALGPPGGRGGIVGGNGINNDDEDDDDLRPGCMVAGGYVLKDLGYPPGYGPRGRFEERGCI